MQIHEVQRRTKQKKSRQVGRGGKRGKTSGRGTKGQKARAGRKLRPESRDTIKRFPKMRGRGKNKLKSIVEKYLPLNLSVIEKVFSDGEKVTPETLIEKKVFTLRKGKLPKVKVLGTGTLTKKLEFSGVAFSESAKGLVEKTGSKIN